jgi:hypothetical protein
MRLVKTQEGRARAATNGYHCVVQHSEQDDPLGAQVEKLGAKLLDQAEDLADDMVSRIQAAVPAYRTEAVVSTEELRRTCVDNIHFVFGPIGRTPALSSPESRENGRLRARAGVPLAAVMEAYRVAARFLWDCLAETAARSAVPAEVTVRAASEMWTVLDTYTQQMADGYRDELTVQALSREQQRSAVVQALLEGRLTEAGSSDNATLLGLPSQGPYVVIAARVPGIGRRAVPDAESILRTIGMASSWQLLHDLEVGIAHLPDPAHRPERDQIDRLTELLGSSTHSHAGISPLYDDLGNSATALRLARIALLSTFDGQRVTAFERDPLAVAVASAPEVMQRIARTVLGTLDQVPSVQRALLLETFGVWLDSRGSADRAAAALFCHPNTVRHRLRRLEALTGRTIADPRQTAELSLAFEIDRRLTPTP